MSVTICLSSGKSQYLSLVLNAYCKLKRNICISYAIDHEKHNIIMESNLQPIINNNLNPDKCFAIKNMSSASGELLERMMQVQIKMAELDSNYRSCIYWVTAKSVLEIILANLFVGNIHEDLGNKMNHVIDTCSYGHGERYLIGTTYEEMTQEMEVTYSYTVDL